MPTEASFLFRLRHDTAANWASQNPVLMEGEPGVEVDTHGLKLGDGVTPWNSLAYSASGGAASDAGASAAAAAASAASASGSATSASGSATSASGSATSASTSAGTATTAKNAAQAAQAAALASQTAAANSATTAGTAAVTSASSATSAAAAAVLAQTYRDQAFDIVASTTDEAMVVVASDPTTAFAIQQTASFAGVGTQAKLDSILAALPAGTEYVYNLTDGAGTLLDIVSGVTS